MRKTTQDWLEQGLRTLAAAGVGGLTIERLTTELGVTKGSFYHHFRNVEDYKARLITYWADQYLSTAGNLPDDSDDLIALLDEIMAEESFGAVSEPEATIRVWAQQDEKVRAAVAQVDAVRRTFVRRVFRSVAGDERQAGLMADMLSAMLIGSMMVIPRLSPERAAAMYREFKRLYAL